MRKPTKFLGAIAVAVLVAAGGSAFTASNSIPASVAGYGDAVVTGVDAATIVTTPWSEDNSKVSEIKFTSTDVRTTLTSNTASLTLKLVDAVVDTSTCQITGATTAWVITCATTTHPGFEEFDTIGLTIV
jgi:hypothetical protein